MAGRSVEDVLSGFMTRSAHPRGPVTGSERRRATASRNVVEEEEEHQEDEQHYEDDAGGDYEYMDTDVVVKRTKAGRFAAQGSSSGVSRRRSRQKDMGWLLSGPSPGGPQDHRIIPSFGGHVAKEIWTNPDARGTITCYNRGRQVKEFAKFEVPSFISRFIKGTGLQHLLHSSFDDLNVNLICAFIERWQPDTNTFHMPFGEITILLHDVLYILGLRIDGDVCAPKIDDRGDLVEALTHVCILFGVPPEELMNLKVNGHKAYSNGAVGIEALKAIWRSDSQSEEDRTVAYLATLLGATLFVDKSSDKVRPSVLAIVSDLKGVPNYAWGAGTLAYLYRQLGQATRVGMKGVAGCLHLLEAWIYLYFPCLRPGSPAPIRQGDPYVMSWRGSPKVTTSFSGLHDYRIRLDNLLPHSVRWVYPTPIHQRFPSTLFSGCLRFMDIVEPYQPDRCLRQFGYRSVIPQPMPRGDCYRPASGSGYKVSGGMYADHNWESMSSHFVRLEAISVPAPTFVEVSDTYYEWYKSITHMYIYPPHLKHGATVVDDLASGNQLGVALAHCVAPLYYMTSGAEKLQYIGETRPQVEDLIGGILGMTLERACESRQGVGTSTEEASGSRMWPESGRDEPTEPEGDRQWGGHYRGWGGW